MSAERGKRRGSADGARVCVHVCACMHPSAHVLMARRGRRGANDNLSHKGRKRKRAQRGKEGEGRERKPEKERESRAKGSKKKKPSMTRTKRKYVKIGKMIQKAKDGARKR